MKHKLFLGKRTQTNLEKTLENARNVAFVWLAESSALQRRTKFPQKAKGTFLTALATIINYTCWQWQQTRIHFSHAHALCRWALAFYLLHSAGCLVNLACSLSALAHWKVGKITWGFCMPPSELVFLKRHTHRAVSVQCRDGLSLMTSDQSPSPIPKESPSLFLTPKSWRAGST